MWCACVCVCVCVGGWVGGGGGAAAMAATAIAQGRCGLQQILDPFLRAAPDPRVQAEFDGLARQVGRRGLLSSNPDSPPLCAARRQCCNLYSLPYLLPPTLPRSTEASTRPSALRLTSR